MCLVIPGRNTATLERQNHYFILFDSPLSAHDYQRRATRICKLVWHETPQDWKSATAIPEGYTFAGEDVRELIQSYTLTPPMQKLSLRQIDEPWTPAIESLVHNQGYAEIVNRPGRSPAEALLRFEGLTPQIDIVKKVINDVELERGLPWTGEYRGFKVDRWEVSSHVHSPMSPLPLKSRQTALDDADDLFAAGSDPRSDSPWSNASGDQGYAEEQAEEKDRSDERGKTVRYIVGFQTDADASAFVRYWHRRPMTGLLTYDYDLAPIVDAEILW